MMTSICTNHSVRRQGFTLIEILFVILIISIMLGVLVVAGKKMAVQSQINRTRIILQKVLDAQTEYTAQTNHFVCPTGTNCDGTTYGNDLDPEQSILDFVYEIRQVPQAAAILRSIDKESLIDNPPLDGEGYPDIIVDRWDTFLQYRLWQPFDMPAFKGQSGSLPPRGSATEPRPYVASAGPDRLWGDYEELQKKHRGESHNADEAQAAEDNLYSYEFN